eukprot:m51a1_g1205 hypothetical protein (376) ;mRNA; f:462488-464420
MSSPRGTSQRPRSPLAERCCPSSPADAACEPQPKRTRTASVSPAPPPQSLSQPPQPPAASGAAEWSWIDAGVASGAAAAALPQDPPGETAQATVWPDMRAHMFPLPLPDALVARAAAAAAGEQQQQQRGAAARIVEVNADLLQSGADVIVHCCNCQHRMGAGVALEIRRRWPEVYEADLRTPVGDARKLGCWSARLAARDGPVVVNLYGQLAYGSARSRRWVSYSAVRTGLVRLLNTLRKQLGEGGVQSIKIATYWLGCARAGGNSGVVMRIFEEVFAGLQSLKQTHSRNVQRSSHWYQNWLNPAFPWNLWFTCPSFVATGVPSDATEADVRALFARDCTTVVKTGPNAWSVLFVNPMTARYHVDRMTRSIRANI